MGCPLHITALRQKCGTLVFVAGGGRRLCRGSGKPPHPHPGALTVHYHLMRHDIPLPLYHPGRSTEEIIALFISITFMLDAVKGMVKSECPVGGHPLQGKLS